MRIYLSFVLIKKYKLHVFNKKPVDFKEPYK